MGKQNNNKSAMLNIRVTRRMKRRLNEFAEGRGETEATIVREALAEYMGRHNPATYHTARHLARLAPLIAAALMSLGVVRQAGMYPSAHFHLSRSHPVAAGLRAIAPGS